MTRVVMFVLTVACVSILTTWQAVMAASLSDKLRESLRDRILSSSGQQKIVCSLELLCGSAVLPRFYLSRDFLPAWISDDSPKPHANLLVQAIRQAVHHGLTPGDYHLGRIEALLAEIDHRSRMNSPIEPEILADLDLLLSDAFLLYASHLTKGRVNPETIRSEWFIKSRDVDLVELLQRALDEREIANVIEELPPQHTGYAALKRALLRYKKLMESGGWPVVPSGPALQKGDRGARVAALRARLMDANHPSDLNEGGQNLFDEMLEKAVLIFQEKHGLKIDGIVGPETLRALNVPVEDRVRQIKLNMERWRWLPHYFGKRYVLVNTANFELDIIEYEQISLTMKVVVGRRYRRTPVFTGRMTYMELNPYWHIPPSIAKKDILPQIQKDIEYLARQSIRIFEGWEAGAPEIDPETINWSLMTPRNFSYKLVQEPGPTNALGRVKFMFPNKFSVYLHDTPARALFEQTKRSFSSGCIRIERPIELAEYLLKDDPEWTREKIIEAIDDRETQILRIPKPIDVHILYWTAWVDQDGTVHFRDDIYGRDKPLDEALAETPPVP
jgi:murein L,D-transpeptidase YcbB/YkuD